MLHAMPHTCPCGSWFEPRARMTPAQRALLRDYLLILWLGVMLTLLVAAWFGVLG